MRKERSNDEVSIDTGLSNDLQPFIERCPALDPNTRPSATPGRPFNEDVSHDPYRMCFRRFRT